MMDWSEFKDKVVKQATPDSNPEDRLWAYEQYREECRQNPRLGPFQNMIGEVRKRATERRREIAARELEESQKAQKSKKRKDVLGWAWYPLPPEKTVYQEQLIQEIETFVEEIREELFGSTEPPFKDDAAVGDWLKPLRQSYLDQHLQNLDSGGSEEIDKLQTQAQPILKRLSELKGWGRRAFIDYDCSEINCYIGGRAPVSFETCLDPVLPRLAEHARRISGWTGFPEVLITHYILTGQRPHLPPMTVRLNPRAWLKEVLITLKDSHYRSISAEIHCREISNDLLLKLGDYARGALQVSTRPSDSKLSKHQVRLRDAYCQVLDEMGHPKRKSSEFWERVGQKTVEAGGRQKKWRSVYQAWRRFCQEYPEQAELLI